jgi:hypothetical protein
MTKHDNQSPDNSGADHIPFYEKIATRNRRGGRAGGAPRGGRPDRDERSPRAGGAPRAGGRPDRDERSPRAGGAPRAGGRPFTPPKECTPVFAAPGKDAQKLLDRFFDLSLDVLPLDSRKLQQLPNDIKELSHELTDERSERRKGYMNDPATLSAYIRYYQWWNLVRLVKLFSTLPVTLKAGDTLADLGSGPLTLPIALWIARPDLRELPLTWYCVDLSSGALSAGEELFLKIAAETGCEPWTIVRVKGAMGVPLRKKVSFVASANMFNEMYLDDSVSVFDFADSQARDLASYALPDASILVVEPGIPRTANFVSLMRRALMKEGFAPAAPCPHEERCPFPGERGKKWCHFVFDTASAPEGLKKLSEQAGLAKDRAALSFVFSRGAKAAVQPVEEKTSGAEDSLSMLSRMSEMYPPLRVRIISDPIRLPGYRTGLYGCSDIGMVLVSGGYEAAKYLEQCASGSCLELPRPNRKELDRDPKSGALLIELDRSKPPARQERQDRPERR